MERSRLWRWQDVVIAEYWQDVDIPILMAIIMIARFAVRILVATGVGRGEWRLRHIWHCRASRHPIRVARRGWPNWQARAPIKHKPAAGDSSAMTTTRIDDGVTHGRRFDGVGVDQAQLAVCEVSICKVLIRVRILGFDRFWVDWVKHILQSRVTVVRPWFARGHRVNKGQIPHVHFVKLADWNCGSVFVAMGQLLVKISLRVTRTTVQFMNTREQALHIFESHILVMASGFICFEILHRTLIQCQKSIVSVPKPFQNCVDAVVE